MKIAIVATHPIQYYTPWYKLLAQQKNLDFTVYYAFVPDKERQGVGFGVPFSWDIPLFEGYRWKALPNKVKPPSLNGFFNSSIPGIYKILRDERPDAVIISGWQSLPMMQALWTCIQLRIPRIVRGDSNAMHNRKFWIRLLHRILLFQYDAFLVTGKSNKEFYLQYGVSQERIFPCYHFVDNGRFQKQFNNIYGERSNIRKIWGIYEGHTCFIYAGKLEQKKRIMDLLKAVELAIKIRKNLHLLVVGTGELMDSARSFVNEYKLPVTFAGFLNQTEMSRAYVVAECLVLPSDFGETWGLVVNEGMVCGLPAIVSDRVGCWPDLVKEGVTGVVYPCGDVQALANRLIEMATNVDKRVEMGKNARELIQSYSVENAVEGTLQAVEFVIKKSR